MPKVLSKKQCQTTPDIYGTQRTLEERILQVNRCKSKTSDKGLKMRNWQVSAGLQSHLTTPPPPLIERLEVTQQLPPLHFHKSKILLRIQEFNPILEATINRLAPLFSKLREEEDGEHFKGNAVRVLPEVKDSLWAWWDRLQDLYHNLEDDKVGHSLTNKEWRQIKGVCNRIKKVPLGNPSSRLVETCTQLHGLNITLPWIQSLWHISTWQTWQIFYLNLFQTLN